MSWDPSTIAGLTRVNETDFEYRQNLISLSGDGGLGQPAVEGDFTYDDTAWGKVPAGLFKTLASCAVNPDPPPDGTWYSGKYVQLQLTLVQEMGRDYGEGAFGFPGAGSNGGAITAFHVSMRGIGTLRAANDIDGADFSDSLPFVTPPGGAAVPTPYLLRPTTLTWPGQDASNQAVKTIWLQSEIDVVTFGFSVVSNSVNSVIGFGAIGWTAPV